MDIYPLEQGSVKKVKIWGTENAERFGLMLTGLRKQENEMVRKSLDGAYDDETNKSTTHEYKIDRSMWRDALTSLLPLIADPKDVMRFFNRAVRFLNRFPREHKRSLVVDYLLANNDIRASIKLATEPLEKKTINRKEEL